MNDSSEQQVTYSPWFVLVVAVFITTLITANIIAVKIIALAGIAMDAGTIIFPVSYIVGDVLTEVYGYRQARRVIWLGFLCNLVTVGSIALAGALPGHESWEAQAAWDRILGFTPRILLASFCAYLVGEFANSFVLARLKIATQGRMLWLRTIGSTLVGQGLDSVVFVLIAFTGVLPGEVIAVMILTQWFIKTGYEAAVTPVTYVVVNFLKRREGRDVFDTDTNFNPLLVGGK